MAARGDHHTLMIEEGVFRSYLPSDLEDAVCKYLDQFASVTLFEDLPPGPVSRHIQQIFEEHIFIEDPSSGPTTEQVWTMGTKTPPSVVEMSIATAVLYHGVRTNCAAAAQHPGDWTECYELSPREVTRTLLSLDWTCAGCLDHSVLSAVKYIARLSALLGLKLVLPRSTWLHRGSPLRPSLHWAALLPSRTHIRSDDLLSDLRVHASNLESLSFWMLRRPLTFVGPSCSFVTTVHDCFFLTLTTNRARANAFSMAHVSARSFFEGLAALPGITMIAESDPSASDGETRASPRDEDPGRAASSTEQHPPSSPDSGTCCPDVDCPSSSSEWEGV